MGVLGYLIIIGAIAALSIGGLLVVNYFAQL